MSTINPNTLILLLLALVTIYKAWREDKHADRIVAKLDKVDGTVDKVHTLTNSSMGAALRANVVALKSDAVSKHRIADLTKETADLAAAQAADIAVSESERLCAQHEAQQSIIDKTAPTAPGFVTYCF